LFEDEFSLSNSATLGHKWSKKGCQPLIQVTQRRKERLTGMGSLNYETGQMTVTFETSGNYKTFKKHLKKVLRVYAKHSKIIMVVDNVRFHHAILLKQWLQKHNRIELVYLPPYSPELNPVERAWWYMRKKITHNRWLKSMEERKEAFWKMFSKFRIPNSELVQVCVINY
jgi:transposase